MHNSHARRASVAPCPNRGTCPSVRAGEGQADEGEEEEGEYDEDEYEEDEYGEDPDELPQTYPDPFADLFVGDREQALVQPRRGGRGRGQQGQQGQAQGKGQE